MGTLFKILIALVLISLALPVIVPVFWFSLMCIVAVLRGLGMI